MFDLLKKPHGVIYFSPKVSIIEMSSPEIVCLSVANTEDYESKDFWGQGEEI